MTTNQTESTADLDQRASGYLTSHLRHLTEIVSARDALHHAWRLATERNIDERAALAAARRQLASLLESEVSV